MSAYVLSNGQRVYPAFVLNDADGGGIVTPPASFRLADGTQVVGIVLVDDTGEMIAAPAAMSDARPDRGETVRFGIATSASGLTANTAYLAEVNACDLPESVTELAAVLGAAPTGGTVDVGIYTANTARTSFTRLGSLGSTAAAPGLVSGTITAVDTTVDRPYYLGISAEKADITIARAVLFTAIGTEDNRCVSFASSHPLPASLSSPTAGATVPYVLAK